MNYTGPKVRLSRRLGVPLTAKAMKVMIGKPYPPGQHTSSRRLTPKSDYGKQLLEKQRLKFQYNIHERKLTNYYKVAAQRKGNTADNLVQILESRLDALVLRAGFAPSIFAARQLVSHSHVLVNDKPVNISSYQVKPGDKVSVKEKSRNIPSLQEALLQAAPPAYVTVDKANYLATYERLPQRDEMPIICEVPLVVEYYSR